jgi:hypothetical protein
MLSLQPPDNRCGKSVRLGSRSSRFDHPGLHEFQKSALDDPDQDFRPENSGSRSERMCFHQPSPRKHQGLQRTQSSNFNTDLPATLEPGVPCNCSAMNALPDETTML